MFSIKFRSFNYERDLEQLFSYMTKEENQRLFSHAFQVHNLPMFERWISEKFFKGEYHDFFMIEDLQGQDIGFTFSYEFFSYDGHCKYTLCLYEKYQNLGLGAVAALKMIDYLFKKYPLNRIFVSVFDYNKNSLKNNKKGGFEEVAVLPEYRFCGGEYYSLHILTISRNEFYGKYQKIISKIKNMKKEKEKHYGIL